MTNCYLLVFSNFQLFQLLHRAVQKRPHKKQEKPKEEEGTVFTEEDFKKFEEEYLNQ